jgi:cytochrome b involved in lipid metabolism
MSELKNFNQEKDLPTPMGKLEITLQTLISNNERLEHILEHIRTKLMEINGFRYNIKKNPDVIETLNNSIPDIGDTLMDKIDIQLKMYNNSVEKVNIVKENLSTRCNILVNEVVIKISNIDSVSHYLNNSKLLKNNYDYSTIQFKRFSSLLV